MNKNDLKDWINQFTMDIEFEYNGTNCLIMPLITDENITLCYGDKDVVLRTADEVMAYPLFDGKCLNDICETIEF